MYEHNALCYRSSFASWLTKVRSSQAGCPATALIFIFAPKHVLWVHVRTNMYINNPGHMT